VDLRRAPRDPRDPREPRDPRPRRVLAGTLVLCGALLALRELDRAAPSHSIIDYGGGGGGGGESGGGGGGGAAPAAGGGGGGGPPGPPPPPPPGGGAGGADPDARGDECWAPPGPSPAPAPAEGCRHAGALRAAAKAGAFRWFGTCDAAREAEELVLFSSTTWAWNARVRSEFVHVSEAGRGGGGRAVVLMLVTRAPGEPPPRDVPADTCVLRVEMEALVRAVVPDPPQWHAQYGWPIGMLYFPLATAPALLLGGGWERLFFLEGDLALVGRWSALFEAVPRECLLWTMRPAVSVPELGTGWMWRDAVRFLEREPPPPGRRYTSWIQGMGLRRELVDQLLRYYAAGDVMFSEMMVPTVAMETGGERARGQVPAEGACHWPEGQVDVDAGLDWVVDKVRRLERECGCRVLSDSSRPDMHLYHPVKTCDGLGWC